MNLASMNTESKVVRKSIYDRIPIVVNFDLLNSVSRGKGTLFKSKVISVPKNV
jgi:hypothetical protein